MKRTTAALGLVTFLLVIPIALASTTGGPFIPHIHWAQVKEGLQGSYLSTDVVVDVFRLTCWILWTYLVTVVLLRAVAAVLVRRHSTFGLALMSASVALTPRFIRKVVDFAIGTALVASTVNLAYAGPLPTAPIAQVAQLPQREEPMPQLHSAHLRSYIVKAGDTLWDIAEDELGSGYRWREIYELNRGRAFANGQVLHNPRLIRPGWELELPALNGEKNPPPAAPPQQTNQVTVDSVPSTSGETRRTTREIEHEKAPLATQPPVIELPSGVAVAASFASGLLAAQALSAIRRRRSRKALADPDEVDPESLILDLRRKAESPVAGHLEAAAFAIAGSWQRVNSSLPRIIAAVEESDRAIFYITKPTSENRLVLPPSSSRILFRDEGDVVLAEVRRPFAPKMVRAETPLETGLLTPLGAVGKERAVHIGLLGLGGISVSGEQADRFTAQTLVSCAADSSSDDLEIYLIGDEANLRLCRDLNHVRASVGWDEAPEILNRIQAELLARARAFMKEGVEDFWSFLATRVDERIRALVLVASKPPALLLGVVEAVASQMHSLGGAFVALDWTPLATDFRVHVNSKVLIETPLPKLPNTLHPLILGSSEMEQAVKVINEARPPGWDSVPPKDELRVEFEEFDEEFDAPESASAEEAIDEPSEDAPQTDQGSEPQQLVVEDESPILLDGISEVIREGQLEVRAFGNFVVVKDGRVIEKGLRTAAKELLAFLVSNPTGVNKDRIIEALFPEQDYESACAELSRHLYFLKRRTGSGRTDHIDRVGESYRLDLQFWWTDVGAFESILTAAGSLAAEDAIGRLSAALDLYRGPFCDDCYYSWLETPRDRYRALFVKSSARLANLLMEYGEPDDAIGVLDRAIEMDSINEDLYRRAMSIEGRIGRSKAVLKRFNKLEAVLQDELDVDPDEETSALLRQIMREVEERKRALKA